MAHAPAKAPADFEHVRASVQLTCVPGVGPRLRQLLLERFGTPEAVFAARFDEILAVDRIGKEIAEAIFAMANDPTADGIIELCRSRDVGIISEASEGYPGLLSHIPDPPGVLFVRGELKPCDAMAIAIVGARHATAYGLRVAEQLGSSLAHAGYTIVSGLARGIDAAAHRGALAAGGRTIAVLGSGVLNIYPPEHGDLATEIIGCGAVISEAPPFAEPFRGAFPQRNRIVSGLSLGVVVVQASDRSGALITARMAGEQGREVFAVPGAIDCRMSRGCHQLIRDGATLVGGVDDILEELGPLFETATDPDGRLIKNPAELQLTTLERHVLDAVCDEPIGIDGIVESTSLAVSQVLATIGVLEVRRLVRRLPGNRVQRT